MQGSTNLLQFFSSCFCRHTYYLAQNLINEYHFDDTLNQKIKVSFYTFSSANSQKRIELLLSKANFK